MRFAFALVALTNTVVLAGCGSDAPARRAEISAQHARLVPASTAGQAFVYVDLTADRDDELVAVSVTEPAGARASIASPAGTQSAGGHLGHLDGKGAPHDDSSATVAVPSGAATSLAPGKAFIRVEGLRSNCGVITLELTFASGAAVEVDAAAVSGAAPCD
ncbi:MAG: hypothetical protein ACKO1Y_01660 [Actinomycetota bacterium]